MIITRVLLGYFFLFLSFFFYTFKFSINAYKFLPIMIDRNKYKNFRFIPIFLLKSHCSRKIRHIYSSFTLLIDLQEYPRILNVAKQIRSKKRFTNFH